MVKSVQFVGVEHTHHMRISLDDEIWTGRMILVLITQVILEFNYVASIIDGWACVDVNNMFDFYLEKDIEDIKELCYHSNGNMFVTGGYFLPENDE